MQKTESYSKDQKEMAPSGESLEATGIAGIMSVHLTQASYNSPLDEFT